jgi:hypothetical protein
MASPQPLLAADDANQGFVPKLKDKLKGGAKKGAMTCIGACFAIFVVVLIIQGVIYSAVTAGCGPKAIGDDYVFPGGGKSANGTAAYNLVPQLALMAERSCGMWGCAFDMLPANEAGATAGAQTGTFWRNSGPLFYTYTYEDIANSKLTAYMRKRFWMPFMSYTIARCDGKGPTYTFTEGSNWISNKIRSLFRVNQAQTYQLYADGNFVANVQEVNSGYPSLTLNDEESGKEKGSAILKERDFHGDSDLWLASNSYSNELPYFLTAMVALPEAFDQAEIKTAKAMSKSPAVTTDKPKDDKSPTLLLESKKNPVQLAAHLAHAHHSTKVEEKVQKATESHGATKSTEKQVDVKVQHV